MFAAIKCVLLRLHLHTLCDYTYGIQQAQKNVSAKLIIYFICGIIIIIHNTCSSSKDLNLNLESESESEFAAGI